MIGLNNMQLAELVARVRAGTGELVSRGRGFSLDLQHSVALVIFCSSLGSIPLLSRHPADESRIRAKVHGAAPAPSKSRG